MCLLGWWGRESWLLRISLAFGLCTVYLGLFAHLGVIGRLCSVIVVLPRHLQYCFTATLMQISFVWVGSVNARVQMLALFRWLAHARQPNAFFCKLYVADGRYILTATNYRAQHCMLNCLQRRKRIVSKEETIQVQCWALYFVRNLQKIFQ